MKIIAYTDGASRGNPGHSGIGIVFYRDTRESLPFSMLGEYIGEATNNVAEYKALIRCLYACLKLCKTETVEEVEIFSDSQLIVYQVTGKYGCYAEHLVPLHKEAKDLLEQFPVWSVKWISRDFNTLADAYSNRAIETRGIVREVRPRK